MFLFKRKNVVGLVIAILCFTFLLPAGVFAGGSRSVSYSGSFNKSWGPKSTGIRYLKDGAAYKIVYWYDTFLINEDGTEAYFNGSPHRSKIRNKNGLHTGGLAPASDYSSLEVRHKGSHITYYLAW